jgi:hypothetical protein
MAVWLADSESSVRLPARPTVASRSRISVSSKGTNPRAINDQFEPASSSDSENSFFHWWPRKSSLEWVEYAFDAPTTVSHAEVYWFDDTGTGECRMPASWKLFYKDGDEWKPVKTNDPYGIEKDRFNRLDFSPVTTTGLRMEVQLQPIGRAAFRSGRWTEFRVRSKPSGTLDAERGTSSGRSSPEGKPCARGIHAPGLLPHCCGPRTCRAPSRRRLCPIVLSHPEFPRN